MNKKTFKKYSFWFDEKMISKNMILLSDRFSIYYTTFNLLQKEFPQGLGNTKVIFLLANITFIC